MVFVSVRDKSAKSAFGLLGKVLFGGAKKAAETEL